MDFDKNVLTFYKNGVESCHADNMPVVNDSKNGYYPSVSINSPPNAVSLVPRPLLPESLKSKLSTKKGGPVNLSGSKLLRTQKVPRTYQLGNELATDGDKADVVTTAVRKPSDPTSFIKRFLKF